MSNFFGVNIPEEEDIYSAGWSTRASYAAGERFYSRFGNVPNKPTTPELLDKTFNKTMTARVFAATENIKRLHNEREDVIRRLGETEDQLRGLKRELRDIDRSVNNLMRRLGGIGDAEDVDDAVARRLVDMEQ
ncbi:hypothetical protein Bbelb_100960 [Branchiostoma belcheri]|nr:hypothetical protein Bbelb_100960 [Branchiostoma belcheri]